MSTRIDIKSASNPPVGATLMKTGQTTSYRTGDDGDLEAGRATDFFTLSTPNPFGNTNRFTDELGGSTYTNDIVIDWSTYDGTNVLGWYRNFYDDANNWNEAIDNSLIKSIGGFTSGWYLPNIGQFFSICNFETASGNVLNYQGFNYTSTAWNVFTSTTNARLTTQCMICTISDGSISPFLKTNGGPRYKPCRTFTVTGTTLT